MMFFHWDQIPCTSFMSSLDSPRFAHHIWIHKMTLNRINWSWNYRDVIRLETDIHSKDEVQEGLADPFGSLNIWERRWCCRLDGEIGRCSHRVLVMWIFQNQKAPANVCPYLRRTCFKMILGVEKSHQNPAPVHIWWMFHKLGWFNHPPSDWPYTWTWSVPFAPFLRLVDSKSETVDFVFLWGRRSDIPFYI